MPCNSDYMESTSSEIDDVIKGTESLKVAVDELVHYCDEVRDIIEAHLDDSTQELPQLTEGHVLAAAVEVQIDKIKDKYAFRTGRGLAQDSAKSMFRVANRAIAQFARVNHAVTRLSRGEQLEEGIIADLRQDQIQHRMGDMMRVYKHFANKKVLTADEVASVSNIDFTKPLTPQLGFDPDDV